MRLFKLIRALSLSMVLLALFYLPTNAQQLVPPGPAAAIRTNDVYNVKLYGAAGDCVTDDRAAIATAVAAIPAAGGGILFFPPGCYATTSSSAVLNITDKNSIVVMGSGIAAGTAGTTLKQYGP